MNEVSRDGFWGVDRPSISRKYTFLLNQTSCRERGVRGVRGEGGER